MTDTELRQLIKYMANWGYDLLEPLHPGSPGGRLLLVAMRRKPTAAHYDPEGLTLLLADERGALGPVALHRDAQFARPSQVCPGRISIVDRVGKQLDFYSFGGLCTVVRVTEPEPFTLFIVESLAPILALNSLMGHRVEDQLVNSTEALFARLRARYAALRLDMLPVLSKIPPLSLYGACIESMWRMYHQSPALSTIFDAFYRLLGSERQWLIGLNGTGPPMVPLEALVDERVAKAAGV